MAMPSLLTLIVLTAVLAVSHSRPLESESGVRRRGLQEFVTDGWWFTFKTKTGNFCTLRDYPPSNDDGTCRVYCLSTTYNHLWMWRIRRVSGSGALASGDQVYLENYNLPGKSCGYKGNILCGLGADAASKFVIEKTSGSGAVNLTVDDFYLKYNDLYCGLSGTGHSQQIKCDKAAKDKSKAIIFNFPASTFGHVALTNQATRQLCGGNFLRNSDTPDGFYCGLATSALKATSLFVGLQTPGAPVVAAGAPLTMKTYDELWSWSRATWQQVGSDVKFVENDDRNKPNQFLSLERLAGAAATGGPLANGTLVAIRSPTNGTYCGLANTNQAALKCDKAGPSAALPDGYKFTYTTTVGY